MKNSLFIVLIIISFCKNLAADPYAAKKILVIGDSHSCGEFGKNLVTSLSSATNLEVVMYCSPGLSVQHFNSGFKPSKPANNCKTYSSTNMTKVDCGGNGNTPKLESIIENENPDYIVPALGTNNLGLNALNHFKIFADTIAKYSSIKCTWVGPPKLLSKTLNVDCPPGQTNSKCEDMCEKVMKSTGSDFAEKLVSAIVSGVDKTCKYIDSREYTDKETAIDCIHRNTKGAVKWVEGIKPEIIENLKLNEKHGVANDNKEEKIEKRNQENEEDGE